jgi:hypothetical protein
LGNQEFLYFICTHRAIGKCGSSVGKCCKLNTGILGCPRKHRKTAAPTSNNVGKSAQGLFYFHSPRPIPTSKHRDTTTKLLTPVTAAAPRSR